VTLSASKVKVGDTHEALLVDDLKRTQLVQYAGASGDYNPLHSDELFAREAAGYKGVFAHGMLTMGMTGKMLTDLVGDGRLKSYGVSFRGIVWPGDTLTGRAVVESVEEVDGEPVARFAVTTVNQDGAEVLKGYAEARLDP